MYITGDIFRIVNEVYLVVAITENNDIVTTMLNQKTEELIVVKTIQIDIFSEDELEESEKLSHNDTFEGLNFIIKSREVLIQRELLKYEKEYKNQKNSIKLLEKNLKYYNLI